MGTATLENHAIKKKALVMLIDLVIDLQHHQNFVSIFNVLLVYIEEATRYNCIERCNQIIHLASLIMILFFLNLRCTPTINVNIPIPEFGKNWYFIVNRI